MSPIDELLAPLRVDPASAVVLCDFDGTLAPIVDDPAAARPVDGAVDALADLARRYRTVAVVSGRPVAFLRSLLPASVELVGLYGLEWLRDGELVDHPQAAPWRAVVDAAARAAVDELPEGVLVEPKGVSLTLHYRTAPHLGLDVDAWSAHRAAADGLEVRPAKMSVELHPPVAVDKGTTVRSLAAGARAACFLGDDVGDLPAFHALRDLRAGGMATAGIAVRTADVAASVLAAADAVVDGQAAAVGILRSL